MGPAPAENLKTIKRDQILFKEGDKADRLILVKSGKILCLRRTKERLVPVHCCEAEGIVGEEALVTGRPHSYSAIALQDSVVIEIQGKTISALLKVTPKWLSGLMQTLATRIIDTEALLADQNIIHDSLSGGKTLSPEEENKLKKLLA
jgi:CRP/FNR family transcriptional regulator, cyclic AMP receptor protein